MSPKPNPWEVVAKPEDKKSTNDSEDEENQFAPMMPQAAQ